MDPAALIPTEPRPPPKALPPHPAAPAPRSAARPFSFWGVIGRNPGGGGAAGGWRREEGWRQAAGAAWGKCLLMLTGEGRDRHNGHLYSAGANRRHSCCVEEKTHYPCPYLCPCFCLCPCLCLCSYPCLCPHPCPCPHTRASAAHPTLPARRFASLPAARPRGLIGPPPRFLQRDWPSPLFSQSDWSFAVSINTSRTPLRRGSAAMLSVAR